MNAWKVLTLVATCALMAGTGFAQESGASGSEAKSEEASGSASKTAPVMEKLAKEIDASENASDAVKAFAKGTLLSLCTNKVFVAEIKAQNAKKISLDDIKKVDQEWKDAEDELPIHVEKMGNACAKEVKKVAGALAGVGEVFVMDNQGANVGQNELTSDYWQGDEAKWKNSFKEGKGGVDIDKSKLDKSTGQVDQKVSLPIIDDDGKVIGAVCFGVIVDKL